MAELVEGAREPRWRSSGSTAARCEAVPYMKAALVESHRDARAPHRVGRADGGRPEPLHRDRALAADRGRRGRHPGRRPGGRGRADRGAWSAGAASATRRRWTQRLAELARVAADPGENVMAADDRRGPRRRHHRRVGADPARRVRRLPRPHRRGRGGGRRRRRGAGRLRERGRPGVGGAGPPAEDAGGQARPGRPLQRRRADRRARPRRGHGGRLRGHPPDAFADRGLGPAGGRARGRPVHPVAARIAS